MQTQGPPLLDGVQHRLVQAGDVRLHVAQAGAGPPLLLLHGWPQHWWCWRHLLPRLAQDYLALAVDLRGWGWSQAPGGDYAKATFAQDIVALLDAEGLQRVRILAHDWGAYAAFLLALERPERIERMVVLDIVPPWATSAPKFGLGLAQLLAYQTLVATPLIGERLMMSGNHFIRTIIRRGSATGARWSQADLDVYANVLREPARAKASSACYRTLLSRELPATRRGGYRPAVLTVPTLLVMGSESVLRKTLAPQPAPSLELRTIDGAGHFLPEEAPDQVLTLASPFLAG